MTPPKEESGISPAEIVYGDQQVLPAQLTAKAKLPVDVILLSLGTTEPISTPHQDLPMQV